MRSPRRPRLSLRSIRVRIVLWYTVLFALTLGSYSAILYVIYSRGLRGEFDGELEHLARQLVSVLSTSPEQAQAYLMALDENPEYADAYVQVISAFGLLEYKSRSLGGTRLSYYPMRGTESEALFVTSQPSGRAPVRICQLPVMRAGDYVGLVQVGRTLSQVTRAEVRLSALFMVAVPILLVAAITMGMFISLRTLAGIDLMTRTASEIGATDLSRRLNMPDTGDEMGRLAATFDQMIDRLERSFQQQRQLVADASHELRTPLTVMRGNVEVGLRREQADAQAYRDTLVAIGEEARRMSRLVDDLLALARADAGQVEMHWEDVELGALVSDVAQDAHAIAGQRKVEVDCVGPSLVRGDAQRLRQLLLNLLENAVRHTPPDGTVSIRLRSAESGDGDWVDLEVADNGEGIAPEDLPHVFERFYRADRDRSRRLGGSGLGLAICRMIAQAHGGTIWAASAPGQGSAFTIRLPRVG